MLDVIVALRTPIATLLAVAAIAAECVWFDVRWYFLIPIALVTAVVVAALVGLVIGVVEKRRYGV